MSMTSAGEHIAELHEQVNYNWVVVDSTYLASTHTEYALALHPSPSLVFALSPVPFA